MKIRNALLAMLLTGFSAGYSRDRADSERNNSLYFHPVELALSGLVLSAPWEFYMTFEHPVGEQVALILQPLCEFGDIKVTMHDVYTGVSESTKLSVLGLGSGLGLRIYFREGEVQGPFFQPEFRLELVTVASENDAKDFVAPGGALALGYSFRFGRFRSYVSLGGRYWAVNPQTLAAGQGSVSFRPGGATIEWSLGLGLGI